VKNKCEQLESSTAVTTHTNTDDIDTILNMAIRYLRKLPVYFSQCQDLVVNSRRSLLVQKFVLALTQGGPAGQLYRAIDLHANDAVRYISDMLAWMHQALASEEEFLQVIFGDHSKAPAEPVATSSPRPKDPKRDEGTAHGSEDLQGMSLQEMLSRCVHGLGRPLRVRIMQTLESKPTVEVLYAILDLLAFYQATFSKILPIENAVHSATKGCYLECKRLFVQTINRQADALISTPSSCPVDLTASHSTKECAKQIRDILKASSSALSSLNHALPDETVESSDGCSLEEVLGQIIQPLLRSCRLSCQSLSQADMAIFMLNNVAAVQVGIYILLASDMIVNGSCSSRWSLKIGRAT
jgi:conserved oligomeric Golgi complex subunit 6